jgi:hypothetical protein
MLAPLPEIYSRILGNHTVPHHNHTAEPAMTSWNPSNPCTVGDLRLPAQFQPIWYLFYADSGLNTEAGHSHRAWLHLPAGMILSFNSRTDESEEIELWRFGALTLTRPMTDSEQLEWWYNYDPTP